ncbi:MAG: hypothetical protein HKN21_01630 [Candidatus Eisenbacteria bacterium]|uniref:Nitrous oxide reductase n=1 Tax=Eiseniibacteriota bacterium TaxID=2212470 RepID=A0A7Y2H1A1_UNCEI|nr:hypothetical protein [Candidatus Eisenbacteria bacterium]
MKMKMNISFFVLLFGAGLVSVVGCEGSGSDGAPTLEMGKSECVACGMVINDTRYAAAIKSATGEVAGFDALECLIRHARRNKKEGDQIWLSDFYDLQMYPESQMMVVLADFPSPMGGGLAAFKDKSKAEEAAATRRGEAGLLADFVSGSIQRKAPR